MKRIVSLFICIGLFVPLMAQTIKIVSPITKISSSDKAYSFARISPDGSSIAASGAGFNGLVLLDLNGTEKKKLSDAQGIGWNFSWDPAGNYVAGRANTWNDKTKLSSIIVCDLSGTVVSESKPSADVSLPYWGISGGSVVWFDQKAGWQSANLNKSNGPVVAIGNGSLHVLYNTKASCASFPENMFPGQILNIAWSPSGSKACIEVAGRGLYVYECANNAIYDLGYGEFPSWLDDEYFVYMEQKDNGQRVTASNIYLKKYNGSDSKNLTMNSGKLAMYPSCEKNGTIVFTTENGELYKMSVTIVK
ncbi:MAG: hypothetical protein LWX56_08760 [Ignavibacteria bacterium]|nr:hypothetical protein [Ignavibacteria bacterium]